MIGREGRERGDDVVREPGAGIFLRAGRRVLDRVSGFDLSPERSGPGPVDRPVDDDPVKPGAERARGVEPVEGTDGGEEGLLRHVLRSGGVVNDEEGSAVGAGPVGAKERLEIGG